MAGAHRRLNQLTGEWVLVSPDRASRPWQGQVEPGARERRPRHDPSCYLCPGGVRAGGDRMPKYSSTYVFDNDFPALRADGQAPEESPGRRGLIVAEPERAVPRGVLLAAARPDAG